MKTALTAAALALLATTASAEDWTLNGDSSRLAFGSIKKHTAGEVHEFQSLSGGVENGMAKIEIDLTSLETYADIRNTRMAEHVFKMAPSASFAAELDMEMLEAMEVGDTAVIDFDGVLSLLGQDVEVYTELFVARMSDSRVMVTTNDMVWLTTEELGIDAGVDKLKELAELSDITRAVPLTVRLFFDKAGSSS
jgi:hypothetical protein